MSFRHRLVLKNVTECRIDGRLSPQFMASANRDSPQRRTTLMISPTVIKRHELWHKGVQPLRITLTPMRTQT